MPAQHTEPASVVERLARMLADEGTGQIGGPYGDRETSR